MTDISIINKLNNIIPEDRIFRDEPMYKHTTFRVGGAARVYINVGSEDELINIIAELNNAGTHYTVIGNGSNLLVSDQGLDGVVLEIGQGMNDITVCGNKVTAMAGAMLSAVAMMACRNELAGMEFASGIPGTVGGAMVMNAGAYGGEMKDIVSEVRALNTCTGEIVTISNDKMMFSYRHSVIKDEPLIVTSVTFSLNPGKEEEIKSVMNELNSKRRQKQPLEYPSAGSTFKRPEGFFAGALIEESGLKGYQVGGAQVSEKHAGFVINKDKATATDIYRLICEVKEQVYADSGVRLEPEVIMLGQF